MSAVMLGIAVLLGSMVYSNTVSANSQEWRDCYDRHMPQNETGYRICIGEIGTPNPDHADSGQ